MALPPGTTTFQLTYGAPASGFGGESLSVSGTITPSVSLTHRVTGAPLVNFGIRFDAQEGMPGSTALPHTEQFVDLGDGPVPAYLDKNGNGFNNWAYLIEGTYRGATGETRSFRKVFQAPPGQTSLDLDLLPEGDVASFPVIAPILPVTDFGGDTGSVSAQRAAELVSPFIEGGGGVADGSVDEVKLAPAVVEKIDSKLDATEAAGFLTEEEAATNYAPNSVVQKIDPAGTSTPATFAVRLDANGDVDALVLNGVDL